MDYPQDEILVKSFRDGYIDEIHSGFVVLKTKNEFKYIKGRPSSYDFYLRSCAKPLQAALLIDYGMDKIFNMTEEEIALCCASHAGEKIHTDILKNLLNKIGFNEDDLKCGLHEPLSKTKRKEMLLSDEKISTLHNNCSGKHIMMLGLCKLKNWDTKTYDNIEHPLQLAIKKKLYELCDLKEEHPVTTDGCGVPIFGMPLENILTGYMNLFCDNKYKKIRDAFLNNPYLIGGEDRTDTKTIQNGNKKLTAKVGAGGLCVIVNIDKKEGFLVKISDCDMKARELVVFEMLNRLNWTTYKPDKSIKTLHGQIVGKYKVLSD